MWAFSRAMFAKAGVLWLVAGVGLLVACNLGDCVRFPVVVSIGWAAFWPLWRLIGEVAKRIVLEMPADVYWVMYLFNLLILCVVWAAAVTGAVVLMQRAVYSLSHR